jgi:formylglycine-generating enzyme required for sulfatase activity
MVILGVLAMPTPFGRLHAAGPEIVTNSIGMKLVFIPAGEFDMGSTESEAGPWNDGENPVHRVRITEPFYLGQYEVTLGEFMEFRKEAKYKVTAEVNGRGQGYSSEKDDLLPFTMRKGAVPWSWGHPNQTMRHPVVIVSRKDAEAFCNWLSRNEQKAYRLPTEAEWEYACRSGTTTRYSFGDDEKQLADYGNSRGKGAEGVIGPPIKDLKDGFAVTAPVGSFKPNSFGLYDMHGNAEEMCSGYFNEEYYRRWSTVCDPTGTTGNGPPVCRGGSWWTMPGACRSAARAANGGQGDCRWGFRVLLVP